MVDSEAEVERRLIENRAEARRERDRIAEREAALDGRIAAAIEDRMRRADSVS